MTIFRPTLQYTTNYYKNILTCMFIRRIMKLRFLLRNRTQPPVTPSINPQR
ncbi:hypothetical protein Hanom_Chr15g01355231 [Helianthus anomalus]